jgi:hypothetical protein
MDRKRGMLTRVLLVDVATAIIGSVFLLRFGAGFYRGHLTLPIGHVGRDPTLSAPLAGVNRRRSEIACFGGRGAIAVDLPPDPKKPALELT